MGIGKAAIAVVLVGVLAFALVSALSIAQNDKPTDPICNGTATCNGTAALATTIGVQSANLMIPVFALVGIIFLYTVLTFLRKTGGS